MPVESIAAGTVLPAAGLSLLASHPLRARLPSAIEIRFPVTGSAGNGGQRSVTDQRAELTRELPLGVQKGES